ncbi:ABC transporter ATP-binding protein [Pararhizobium mangrovi]|uniref:sn-glycerol-3-phosphate ABC transporter ATP-binding protein UgpC n=1 Tax=Pararhizobium mangrovi TaxID=2590452 RepID=A0A506U7U2_9HYPH|nr:sn-glycerol-3-phosphate ABC transporter ATP-binding protein UgpC [Pararhizobium mangrovi]TPW29025.1 sn-glycerol-3-phosphate ABC transporter ATP-binding protein UgpC [Pararhizobium mangrovi]
MATIDIDGVRKRFGNVDVLHGVDLTIADGEFVVLVGPSGCGKSTLLRLIAGLEDISRGAIRIDGERVNDLAPRARDIAMVFQSYALYPHMSVERNMDYSLRLRKTPAERAREAVEGAAGKLGIDRLLQRKPRTLSGGQRQRVAMGRAIVRTPKAFLFDEPLSNLDARLREQMRGEIKKMHQDLGATSIYVTHDQIEAMTLADRIVAMNEGLVQQIGPPRELYEHPTNLFVAGFIGSPAMNFIDATYRREGQNAFLVVGEKRLALDERDVADGTPVTLGLRAEDIAIDADPEDPGAIEATVELVEPLGLGTIVHVQALGTHIKALSLAVVEHRVGSRIWIRPHPEKFHVFEEATGRRLERKAQFAAELPA